MPETTHNYRFAGLDLTSSLPLPDLPLAAAPARPCYRIRATPDPLFPGGLVNWRHTWIDANGAAILFGARAGDDYFLRFPGIGEARLGIDGVIAVWRDPAASAESLRHALIDQILPRRLAHGGMMMLHAGAIVVDARRCIVVVGDSGLGKSTLSAALINTGCQLLTDDCVRLDRVGQSVRAIATYPGLRLLPDSLTALFGQAPPESQPVAHYTPKRRLTQSMAGDTPTPLVSAILVLQPPPTDAQIHIAPLPPAQACMALVANTFQLDPSDVARARQLLAQAATVTDRVPVYSLAYPRDYAMLSAVTGRIKTLGCDV